MLVVGFSGDTAPITTGWDLWGFYVVDPWYPKGVPNFGPYNLKPNYYLTEGLWDGSYFFPYNNVSAKGAHDGHPAARDTIWDYNYTLVLRKASSVQPPVNFANSAPTYTDGHGGVKDPGSIEPPQSSIASIGSSSNSLNNTATYASLADAVSAGISANGLAGNNGLGVPLAGVTVGDVTFVQSLDQTTSNYYLVTLNQAGAPVAEAVVLTNGSSYLFGGVGLVDPGFKQPTAAQAAKLLNAGTSSVHAVWRQSRTSPTPFFPTWVSSGGSSSATRALSMAGTLQQLP